VTLLERSSKTRFTNRNKIRTAEGWTWLTVPVKTAGLGQPLIHNVELDIEQRWSDKHCRSITQSYSRATHFAAHRNWLEDFYSQSWTHLAPMLRTSLLYLLDVIGIETPLLFSSNMEVGGQKSELILNICKQAGATTYLSGPFGRDYLDAEAFEAAGINIEFDDYKHPVYPQMHAGFQPYMSVIDLLFNCGDASLRLLRNE
jgi:WbqC-like protein family